MPRWLNRVAALGPAWATLAEGIEASRAAAGRLPRPGDLALVLRDLPHAEPSRTDTANTLAEWRATGWLKHRLLVVALNEAGLSARLIMASYRFDRSLAWLPATITPPDGLDVWSFALVDFGAGETPVDITWPRDLARFGFPVLGRTLELGRPAIAPVEVFEQAKDAGGDRAREAWRMELAGDAIGPLLAARAALEAFAAEWTPPVPPAAGIAASLANADLFGGS